MTKLAFLLQRSQGLHLIFDSEVGIDASWLEYVKCLCAPKLRVDVVHASPQVLGPVKPMINKTDQWTATIEKLLKENEYIRAIGGVTVSLCSSLRITSNVRVCLTVLDDIRTLTARNALLA